MRLCPDRPFQFDRTLHDPRLQRCIELAQLLLCPLLRLVPDNQGVGHVVERRAETADFRGSIFEVCPGVIVAIAPLGGDVEQTLDRAANEISATGPGRIDRSEEADEDQPDTAPGGAVDRTERFGFDWPALRKKSFGGRAGGTKPKIRVAPSTPTASSHPA